MNEISTLAISHPKFSLSRTGIEFHEELSFDEWDSLGRELAPVANSIGFIVGDWINYGEKRYGEMYSEAIKLTGIALETLQQYSYVARKIQRCDRSHLLGWTHHLVVAKIKDPEEQRHWLDMAHKHKLSKRRLQKSINFGRLATDSEVQGDPLDRGHVTYLALLNRIRRWWARETDKAPVDEWDDERRQVLKEDFKLILDIYQAL